MNCNCVSPFSNIRIFLCCAAMLLLSACGLFGDKQPVAVEDEGSEAKQTAAKQEPRPERRKTTTVDVEKLQSADEAARSEIEIMWGIPSDPVEGFVIRYGYEEERLEFSETIQAAQVEKLEDPVHGFVYRHHLKNIPSDKEIFLTISAFKQNEESPPSRVFHVTSGEAAD